jgi:1-acyl-sn-glycerol-3-phosphate acyltransferase
VGTLGRLLFALWSFLWAVLTTSFHSVMYILAFALRSPRLALWVERSFYGSLLAGIGVRLHVEGRDRIPKDRSFVAMANHRSYLDIPALVLALYPTPVVLVAKKELTRIPFLGWAIAYSHHIVVDRGNREQAVLALQEAIAKIRKGIALGVFPEGTRSSARSLLPFKKGGFYVAVDSGMPILPVSISNSGRLFGKNSGLPRPGVIQVRIHPVVLPGPGGRAEIPSLLQTVRRTIVSGVPEVEEPPAAPASSRGLPLTGGAV